MRERVVAASLSVLLLAVALAAAQAPPPVDAARVRDLLVLIGAPDQKGALEAAEELQRMGPGVGPALVEALQTTPACQVQFLTSGVLRQLQIEPALVETTLVDLARGACPASTLADAGLQHRAALAIVDRPGGIRLLATLLRDRDPFARRRAVFALDELTERLQPDHPRAIAPTPEILAATEAVLQPLRSVAVSERLKEIRCLAFEAVDQARRLPHEVLRARATALLAHADVDCGSAPGTTERGVSTDRTPRESWEKIISRLESQPPALAAQTSSALLAAGDDVVPLLQKRLGQTDTCRGLALVAGVLESRNVAASDVEAALARVVAGKCEGRDPFALTLAQSAANASVARPEGIARLAGHLTDRDVAVRRRVAGALGVLFERLGMGEAAQPTADPALVNAARGALPALLTAATTERDQAARCQAVRALQRAQEAQDETLRAEAQAQTSGRTLRCLAPPNP